ncbi:MAG: FG-GAP repeat protein [Deltaproteobacteria bacterium]|nr:FG-GAP repeat protein [Deltaproteobacteria bacterium]
MAADLPELDELAARLVGLACLAPLVASCWQSYRIESDDDPFAPGAPRPLVPENGTMTGSVWAPPSLLLLRPEFRWLPAEDDAPAADAYEIQVDDSCSTPGFSECGFPSPEASASGVAATRWRPETALPVDSIPPVGRRYYWRVRAWSDGRPSRWSSVRYLDVGRTPRDFDGDGYAEVVVGARYQPRIEQGEGGVYVYSGGPGGVVPSSMVLLENPLHQQNGHFGWSLAAAGDVNADGFGDLLVGAQQNDVPSLGTGAAYLYLGGAAGLRPEPDAALDDPWPQVDSLFGSAAASAGDIDADGFCDLVVGARARYGETRNEGAVFVFRGSASGVVEGWVQGLRSPAPQPEAAFGFVLGPAGDGNGDGYADLAVATPDQDGSEADEGAVFWYPGGPFGIRDDAVVPLTRSSGQAAAKFGAAVANLGDLDGDGYADLAVGEPGFDTSCAGTFTGCGRVSVFGGSRTGVSAVVALTLEERPSASHIDVFGRGLSGGRDTDGDGRPDLVVLYDASGAMDDDLEIVSVFLSGAGLVSGLPDRRLTTTRGSFRAVLASPGDVNGDGLADLAVGFASVEVHLFHGAAGGFPVRATAVLSAPTHTAYDYAGTLG